MIRLVGVEIVLLIGNECRTVLQQMHKPTVQSSKQMNWFHMRLCEHHPQYSTCHKCTEWQVMSCDIPEYLCDFIFILHLQLLSLSTSFNNT
jgi:hypothetical protein